MQYKILINGKARVGKDTVCSFLMKDLCAENKYIKLAFADPLKKIILEMYPQIDPEWLWGPSELRDNIINGAFDCNGNALTVRQLLLDLGKFIRSYNSSTLINVAEYKTNKTSKHIIIPDGRLIDEYTMAVKFGYYLIRIKRPNNKYKVNDVSETDMDKIPDSKFDDIIINNGSLDELVKKVHSVSQNIIKHALISI